MIVERLQKDCICNLLQYSPKNGNISELYKVGGGAIETRMHHHLADVISHNARDRWTELESTDYLKTKRLGGRLA